MNADEAFEKISRMMLTKFLERNPDFATLIGLHEPYDHLLPTGTTEHIMEDLRIMEETVKRLNSELKREELNDQHKIDLEILERACERWKFVLHEQRIHELDPNAFLDLGAVVFVMFTRDYAPLEKRVDFACFAAEEKGLFGSRMWVNKHLEELDKDHTYVLNLDGVGRGKKFFLNKGLGVVFKKHSDPMLCRTISEVCSELHLPLEEGWGGESDHAEFVSKKFRTCAIMRADPEKAGVARLMLRSLFRIPLKNKVIGVADWIHTEEDTVKWIDEAKMEETVQLTVNFVEKLSQTRTNSVG